MRVAEPGEPAVRRRGLSRRTSLAAAKVTHLDVVVRQREQPCGWHTVYASSPTRGPQARTRVAWRRAWRGSRRRDGRTEPGQRAMSAAASSAQMAEMATSWLVRRSSSKARSRSGASTASRHRRASTLPPPHTPRGRQPHRVHQLIQEGGRWVEEAVLMDNAETELVHHVRQWARRPGGISWAMRLGDARSGPPPASLPESALAPATWGHQLRFQWPNRRIERETTETETASRISRYAQGWGRSS